MRMMFESFARGLLGIRYRRVFREAAVCALLFWALRSTGYRIRIASEVFIYHEHALRGRRHVEDGFFRGKRRSSGRSAAVALSQTKADICLCGSLRDLYACLPRSCL